MRKLIFISVLLMSISSLAQQQAMYTHYSFNTLGINPAYAGSRNALTINALHRSQWVSFPGAPITQTFTAHTPLLNNKLGAGFSFVTDKAGPVRNTGFFIDLAYKLKLGKGNLSVGLKGGLAIRGNKMDQLTQTTPGDPEFQSGTVTDILPNVGFGIYYSLPRFYVGFSTPKVVQNRIDDIGSAVNGAGEIRHFYFIAGGMINLTSNGNLKLKPTTFFKMTAGAPAELDVTLLLQFKDLFWAGPMWRTADAVGVLAGVNITDQFSAGYSFDWSYALSTGKYNGGSHEIMLRYDLVFKNKENVVSPRYF